MIQIPPLPLTNRQVQLLAKLIELADTMPDANDRWASPRQLGTTELPLRGLEKFNLVESRREAHYTIFRITSLGRKTSTVRKSKQVPSNPLPP